MNALKRRFPLMDGYVEVLRRAWSIRLMLLCALLDAMNAGVGVLAGSPPCDPVIFSLITCGLSLAAAVARLVAQAGVPGAEPKGGA